jgi:hypothetical protein
MEWTTFEVQRSQYDPNMDSRFESNILSGGTAIRLLNLPERSLDHSEPLAPVAAIGQQISDRFEVSLPAIAVRHDIARDEF